MEEDIGGLGEASLHLSAPPRLFERLAQISGFTWDQSTEAFHSVSSSRKEKKACLRKY